jgi:outer membrane protein OmpA-like peptidoglycan-associated protein
MQAPSRFLRFAACAMLFVSTALVAQTNDVLQQKDVTPNALINALTPAAANNAASTEASAAAPAEAGSEAASAASTVRTRSFKIVKNQPAASKGPAKSASASLMITFETESARLTTDSKRILDNLATALTSDKLASFKFNIEGHADSRGNADKNLKLSEERAASVRQYLISQHQIDGGRLISIGKGDTEQLNPGNPSAPENRRVRVVTVTE